MKNHPGKKLIKAIVITVIWFAIWQIICLLVGRELLIPSPLRVLIKLWTLAGTGRFWSNIALSILRIVIGYLAALAVGSLIGILTALSGLLDAFLSPIAKIIRATPVASFIILLFVFLARNHIPAFTAFLMVVPLVWANVYEGIKNCDQNLLEMAQVFCLRRRTILGKIYLPSVMPFFLAAARTGMGLAWKAGIAAEVLTSPTYGIGTALYNSKIYLETTDLFAWTCVIILISVILEKLFLQLIRKLPFGQTSGVPHHRNAPQDKNMHSPRSKH